MAKIRVYSIFDPDIIGSVMVHHFFFIDPYEPGAYHTVYAYLPEEYAPTVHAWQTCVNYDHGLLAAQSWAGRPAMINDICLACRYWAFGANLPRWNIYRGEERPKYDPLFAEYPAHFVPCFFMPWWADPPPGYGQEP